MPKILRSRNGRPVADTLMSDFRPGAYWMNDGTIYDFTFGSDGLEDILPDPDYDQEGFEDAVPEIAIMISVDPSDIADADGWHDVGVVYFDEYGADGEFLDNGSGYVYYEGETIGAYCRRNGLAVPVRALTEKEEEMLER